MKSKPIRVLEVILSIYCVLSLLSVLAAVGCIGWDFMDSRKTGEHRVLPDMLLAEETVSRYDLTGQDYFEAQGAVYNEMIDFSIELTKQGYVYETAAARFINLSMSNAVVCLCVYLMFRAWKVRPRKIFCFMALGALVIRLISMWLAHAYLGEAERIVDFLLVYSLDFRYFDKPLLSVWLLISVSVWICGVLFNRLPDKNPDPEDLPPEEDDA